jgi:hypothetical protein
MDLHNPATGCSLLERDPGFVRVEDELLVEDPMTLPLFFFTLF